MLPPFFACGVTLLRNDRKQLYSLLVDHGKRLAPTFSVAEIVSIMDHLPQQEALMGDVNSGLVSQLMVCAFEESMFLL